VQIVQQHGQVHRVVVKGEGLVERHVVPDEIPLDLEVAREQEVQARLDAHHVRRGEHERAALPQHARHLAQHGQMVRHVLQHLGKHHAVEAGVGIGQGLQEVHPGIHRHAGRCSGVYGIIAAAHLIPGVQQGIGQDSRAAGELQHAGAGPHLLAHQLKGLELGVAKGFNGMLHAGALLQEGH
jgi:hypothetical protein